MYVTHTVYKHSDICNILDNTHAKYERKRHYLIQQHFIAICSYCLVAWQPKLTTIFINTLTIMYWWLLGTLCFPGSLKQK